MPRETPPNAFPDPNPNSQPEGQPDSHPSTSISPGSKAISASRDRIQSLSLLWILVPVLIALNLQAWTFSLTQGHALRLQFIEALGLSLLFAATVKLLKAATLPAALCGGLVCLLIAFYTGSPRLNPMHSGLSPLLELFILTFAATRAGRTRKQRARLAESRRGRSASQVLANLGAAGLLSSSAGAWLVQAAETLTGGFLFIPLAIPVLVLAVLAEATADTVSSEIGQAFGGPPIMLTTFKRVLPGTDGAVTLLGTAAGLFGAALVAAVGIWALRLSAAEALIAFAAGTAGLFFDSLIGATAERQGWLGNDLVNFFSTCFAALTALFLLFCFSPRIG